MDLFIWFFVGCMVLGVLMRMAMGQSASEATRNTFNAASAPTRGAIKVGTFGWKVWRKM
jgi:hypothetical protein